MTFYRYEGRKYADISDGDYVTSFEPAVEVTEYNLHKETPKGYWISLFDNFDKATSKWVSKTTKKRFAYPTREEALNAFIKRKEHQIKILRNQLEDTKQYLEIAKGMKL